jgi:hypothetical protein
MARVSDREILGAVERLREEWPELLGSEAKAVARRLEETSYDDPESVRRSANRVLDILYRHPKALQRVKSELGTTGDLEVYRKGFQPQPGGPSDIPAGTLMVCPEEPTHYQRRLRQKGQRLFCPDHGKELVPADALPAEE